MGSNPRKDKRKLSRRAIAKSAGRPRKVHGEIPDDELRGIDRRKLREIKEICIAHKEELSQILQSAQRNRATSRFYQFAQRIIDIIDRAAEIDYLSKQRIQEAWYKRLKPLCGDARRSIVKVRQELDPPASREKLWNRYTWSLSAEDKLLAEQATPPTDIAQQLTTKELEASRLTKQINRLESLHLVPKEIFFDLAQTTSPMSPAQVARKYACKIAGISEGTVTHLRRMGK